MRRAQSFHIDQREDNDSWLDSQRRWLTIIDDDDDADNDNDDNGENMVMLLIVALTIFW